MWDAAELRDVALRSLELRAAVEEHRGLAAIDSLLRALDSLDEAAVVASMRRDLERSFRQYARLARPLAAIVWTWSGAEVEPHVPTDVWGSGHATVELGPDEPVFSGSGGFGFAPLDEWLQDLGSRPALRQVGALEPAVKLVVARSLLLATRALRESLESEAFRALPRLAPFAFFARPGDGEPLALLLSVS